MKLVKTSNDFLSFTILNYTRPPHYTTLNFLQFYIVLYMLVYFHCRNILTQSQYFLLIIVSLELYVGSSSLIWKSFFIHKLDALLYMNNANFFERLFFFIKTNIILNWKNFICSKVTTTEKKHKFISALNICSSIKSFWVIRGDNKHEQPAIN